MPVPQWIVFTILGAVGWASSQHRAQRSEPSPTSRRVDRRLYEAFARHYDMTFDTGRHGLPKLSRHQGAHRIRTEVVRGQDRRSYHLRLEVTGAPRSLSIAHTRTGGDPDPVTGDDAFDKLAFIEGPANVVRTSLNEAAREAVAELLGLGGYIDEGRARLTVSAAPMSFDLLRELSDTVFAAARALRYADDQAEQRLVDIASRDSYPAVRAQALHHLALHHPDAPAVTRLLQDALSTREDPLSTGVAAFHAKRTDVLIELADPRSYPIATCLGALRALKGDWAPQAWGAALVPAVVFGDARLATVALHHAVEAPVDAQVEVLTAVARGDRSVHRDATVVSATARLVDAIASQHTLASEAALVAAATHPSRTVWNTALNRLASDGTARAIEGLLAIEAEASRLGPKRGAVRATIDQIQAKLKGAEAGRVSLSDHATHGGVSLVSSEIVGGVSLAATLSSDTPQ